MANFQNQPDSTSPETIELLASGLLACVPDEQHYLLIALGEKVGISVTEDDLTPARISATQHALLNQTLEQLGPLLSRVTEPEAIQQAIGIVDSLRAMADARIKKLVDLPTSVSRINRSLEVIPLPDESIRSIAASADVDITLEDLAAETHLRLSSDKETRYLTYVRFADAFWNTVKNIPVRVEREPGETAIILTVGKRSAALPVCASPDSLSTGLSTLHTTLAHGFQDEVVQTYDACQSINPEYFSTFEERCERIRSGSNEGSQLVMAVASALLLGGPQESPLSILPEDFSRNMNAKISSVKQIMKFNIIADEFLDAFMYGGINLFTSVPGSEKDALHSDYSIAVRPRILNLMEDIGHQTCIGKKGQPIALVELFEQIHRLMDFHLGEEEKLSDSMELGFHFEGALTERGGETDPHRSFRLLERDLFNDMSRAPVTEWHPQKREFLMAALLTKSVSSWHTEPAVRMLSACPMLYSQQLVPWYQKVIAPVMDWYSLSQK